MINFKDFFVFFLKIEINFFKPLLSFLADTRFRAPLIFHLIIFLNLKLIFSSFNVGMEI